MAASDYAEKDANLLGSVGNSQTGEHTFTRGWKGESTTRRAEIEAELRAILTVTDPKCERGKITFTGLYDVVSSGWDIQYGGYTQILKKRMPYSNALITTADTMYESNTTQEFVNQEPPATSTTWIGAFVAGVSKQISAAADAMKKWRYSASATTSKFVVIHVAIKTRFAGGTEHHVICKNQRGASPSYNVTATDGYALPALAEGDNMMYDFGGVPRMNPDGTWDWYIVYKEDNLAISAGESRIMLRVRFQMRKSFRDDDRYTGVWWQKFYWYSIIQITAHATKEAAWAVASQLSYKPEVPQFVAPGVWITTLEIEGGLPMKIWDEPAELTE